MVANGVEVRRFGSVAELGEVAQTLAPTENDEPDPVPDHRLEHVVSICEHLADRVVGRQ